MLWAPAKVRKLARDLADLAANELLQVPARVRQPRAERTAARIVAEARTTPEFMTIVRKIHKASLHLSHPRYMGQQVAAPIPGAALLESVVAAMNQSLAVWEMSPIATVIDRDLMCDFKRLFGFPVHAGGSLTPGGGFSNLTALLVARDNLAPRARRRGVARVAVIAGEQTHYSVARAARVLGLGEDAVFRVPLTREFCTDLNRLEEAISRSKKRGFRKLILVGSAGSTSTGSFDRLSELRDVATREGAWFHVDAAHGGGLAFSRSFSSRLQGIDSVDSLAFDPHKMMFMPLTSAGIMVREGSQLKASFREHAPYLFGAKRRWEDIGESTMACSQRFDALKVWMLWRTYGGAVWDTLTTHVCELARTAFEHCSHSETLEPLHEPHCNILCFQVRGRPQTDASDRLHWRIKEQLNDSGYGYISSTVLKKRRVLRLAIMNPRTQVEDVCAVLSRVEKLARL